MKRPRVLKRPFSYIYLVLGVIVTTIELFGVSTDSRGDTISENYWWLAEHTYGLVHIPMLGFLGWLAYHFLFQGARSRYKK